LISGAEEDENLLRKGGGGGRSYHFASTKGSFSSAYLNACRGREKKGTKEARVRDGKKRKGGENLLKL